MNQPSDWSSSPSDQLTLRVDTKEAQGAADLESITYDLTQTELCSRRLIGLPDTPENESLRFALIDSAVIRYRRCFSSGLRVKLDRQVVETSAAPFIEIHDYFFDLANKHIAHSVSAMECAFSIIHVDVNDSDNPKVTGHGVAHIYGEPNAENFLGLAELCATLRANYVEPEYHRLMAVFASQSASMSPDEIRKLKPPMMPVNLDQTNIGDRRS